MELTKSTDELTLSPFIELENFLNTTNHNLKTLNLLDPDILSNLDTAGVDKLQLLKDLKAYQRILRIIPDIEDAHQITLNLLRSGINSSVQIATMTRKKWMDEYGDQFIGSDLIARQVYQNAIAVRSGILLKFMMIRQNREPFNLAR